MRRIRIVMLMLAAIALAALVAPEAWRFAVTKYHYRELSEWARRPKRLPWRADDEHRFPRERFDFLWENSHGERIDTFADSVTKDMVGAPDTTIRLALSEAEMDTLWRLAIAGRLFELDSSRLEMRAVRRPHGVRYRLLLRAGDVTHQLAWDFEHGDAIPSDEWKRLLDFQWRALDIVRRHPAYRRLPRRAGGYI